MSKAVRILGGSLVGLTVDRIGMAQQTNSFQPSGPEMVFILVLLAFVIGGWVGYEWIRKSKAL